MIECVRCLFNLAYLLIQYHHECIAQLAKKTQQKPSFKFIVANPNVNTKCEEGGLKWQISFVCIKVIVSMHLLIQI